jgi:hypothetical protein
MEEEDKDYITWIDGNAYYYRWIPAEIRPYIMVDSMVKCNTINNADDNV